MERRLDDWLTSYLEYTENSESPISYHTWAGVSCIAGALQRKVYMRLGHSTLYPNNYIVLVGPSANARKGEPLVIARDIIEELNVYTIGEDSTPEALIRDIKGSELTFQDPSTGDWKWHSSVTGFIEELAVFTGHQNTSFLAYLTNWYDSRDKWTRRTKHQGVDEIIGMCFNFLASTAPDWLPHILTKEAIGGGFTSRCIFVVEDRKRKTVLDPNKNMPSQRLRSDLIHDLEIINTIVGQYDWDKQAKQEYEDWYAEQDRRVTSGESILGDPILDGYVGRRPSHIRKISMICAASHSNELVITSSDFQCSKILLESAEKKMAQIFSGVGRGKYVAETDMIIKYVKSRRRVSKSTMLRDLYRSLDKDSFKNIMETLIEMKIIRSRLSTEDNEMYYEYRGSD